MDITNQANERIEELADKHENECRQICYYQQELGQALRLLDKIADVHYEALREGANGAALKSGALMHQTRALRAEVRESERRCGNGR
jgi:hypothetical protein